MGAGGLGLLRDPDLRLRVTQYAQSVESFNSFAADLSGFQLREMRPTLGRVLPLADRRMAEMMGNAGRNVCLPKPGLRWSLGRHPITIRRTSRVEL